MIKALIFDFDGLILDTEGPEYQSWQEIYQAYGCSLFLPKWTEAIGSHDTFAPYDDLAQQLGRPIDRAAVRAKQRTRFNELMADQSILPGVERYILMARELGLKLGLASSSSRSWVTGYLAQLKLEAYFDSITCGDDVERTKPDPALYLDTLQALKVKAHEAIALEDSPNGVLAAKRAGIFCVAVPNAMTQQLSFGLADLQTSSLADLSLEELLVKATYGGKHISANEEE
jgi:HAD superfamily hydrolase (TIGR01509 family)